MWFFSFLESLMDTFSELIELSMKDKKGLTFYIKGQTVVGYVTKIGDNGGTIEVRNQTLSRIIVRLDQVDAVGIS
jgi:hypothetical protein